MLENRKVLSLHESSSGSETPTRNNDHIQVAVWRKVAAVIFAAMVVGPLLAGMFYSYFTGGNAQRTIGDFISITYPYAGYFVLIALALGVWDLYHRYRHK